MAILTFIFQMAEFRGTPVLSASDFLVVGTKISAISQCSSHVHTSVNLPYCTHKPRGEFYSLQHKTRHDYLSSPDFSIKAAV